MADAHKNEMTETAWASGLFEGEGCIHVSEQKGRPRIVLTLGMCDLDVVERFAAWAGVGNLNLRPSPRDGVRDFHVWTVNGRAAGPVLEAMLPFFGERRSVKALDALAAIALLGVPNRDKTECPHGHSLADAYIQASGSRRCKACCNLRSKARRERVSASA